MSLVIGGLIVAGFAAYQLGIFDRPPFRFYENLVNNKDQSYLIALLAFSTEKKIGKHICRLMNGVNNGILKSSTKSQAMLTTARRLYTSSDSEDGSVGVGLYFDDPTKSDNPRWAAGFAIQADSFDEVQKLVSTVQENSGLSEVIKAVRIGKGSNILKANIPYHNSMTPMIAPMIQWKRAYETYDKGGYKSFNNRPKDDCPAPALEVYFTGTNFSSMTGMDYIVLIGDTTETYDDCYARDE
jgi:hypothetical protein